MLWVSDTLRFKICHSAKLFGSSTVSYYVSHVVGVFCALPGLTFSIARAF